MGTVFDDAKKYLDTAEAEQRRCMAHWLWLRWRVQQERAHWPAVTKMPLARPDNPN